MSLQPPNRSAVLGMIVGLVCGLLVFRVVRFVYVGVPFAVCVGLLALHAIVARDVDFSWTKGPHLRRSLAGVVAVIAGVLCFTILVAGIVETVNLGYFRAEDSTLAHLFHVRVFAELTTCFAAYLSVRSFQQDQRPIATLVASSTLLFVVWTIVSSVLSIEVAIAWMGVFAIYTVMLVRGDLIALGVDMGQTKQPNQALQTTPVTRSEI